MPLVLYMCVHECQRALALTMISFIIFNIHQRSLPAWITWIGAHNLFKHVPNKMCGTSSGLTGGPPESDLIASNTLHQTPISAYTTYKPLHKSTLLYFCYNIQGDLNDHDFRQTPSLQHP